MRALRWTCLLIGLTGCAAHTPAPVAAKPPPAPVKVPAAAVPTPAPHVIDSSMCQQTCRNRLMSCQESPTQCDGLYSECLSHC